MGVPLGLCGWCGHGLSISAGWSGQAGGGEALGREAHLPWQRLGVVPRESWMHCCPDSSRAGKQGLSSSCLFWPFADPRNT